MAAQARSYEKNISYSSRQVDDKYLQKNHHRGNAPSSRDSSPYRSKSNNHHSSPNGRKRPYDSPSSVSSKHSSNSPYETSRKKDRGMNNFVKSSNPGQIESDWSQHVSSSGKIYYYNKRTEESQWEVPKDWIERQKDSKDIQRTNSLLKDTQISSTSFNTKNLPQNDRLIRDIQDSKFYKLPPDKNTFSRDYREQDSKTYKDFRNNRDNHKSESWNNRDRDRDYRNNRDSRDYYDAKYRSSSGSSSKRDSRYNSSSVKTLGQSTPFSSTTSVNRTYRGTPDQLNGFDTVQDISPPGTPTSDDIMNLSNISPAPIYTPHGCSPLLNTSNSIITIPTTPCTPLLSPVVLNVGGNIVGQLPTPFLHPLQQALLLQQQQVTSTNKDIYGSPKLPTVKNHLADSGSASSSPRLSSSSFHQRSNSHSSPLHSSRSNSNSTPPPPPPPLKGQLSENRDVGRSAKVDRYHRNVDSRMEHHTSTRDSLNRSKSYDNRNDDTPLKPKSSEVRYNADRSAKKQKFDCDFPELPNVDQYFSNYAHSLGDFSTGFYGSVFEKQASTAWDETMCLLHADGYQTKHKLYMSKHGSNLHESKFDVAANWSGALHTVLLKVESLQDSSLASSEVRSRDYKSSPIFRKQKYDTNMESNGTDNANKTKTDVNQETVEIVGDKLQPSSDTKLPR